MEFRSVLGILFLILAISLFVAPRQTIHEVADVFHYAKQQFAE